MISDLKEDAYKQMNDIKKSMQKLNEKLNHLEKKSTN
jgi:predicted transcriptional regulator